MILDTRKKLTAFFNQSLVKAGKDKDPNRLVFTLNATMSLNLILNGLLEAGDHVVTTHLEHNSVLRPVNHKVKEGVEATFNALAPTTDSLVAIAWPLSMYLE